MQASEWLPYTDTMCNALVTFKPLICVSFRGLVELNWHRWVAKPGTVLLYKGGREEKWGEKKKKEEGRERGGGRERGKFEFQIISEDNNTIIIILMQE